MSRRSEEMAALYRNGWTLAEIGSVYGITRVAVHGALGRIGVSADDRYQAVYGCTPEQWAEIKSVATNPTPVKAFRQQRFNAGIRGVEWNLTLWQWWTVWRDSGKWNLRGKGDGLYVMCRSGDVGPYEVGNVYIETGNHNGAVQLNNPQRKSHPNHASALQARAA